MNKEKSFYENKRWFKKILQDYNNITGWVKHKGFKENRRPVKSKKRRTKEGKSLHVPVLWTNIPT